MDWKQLWDIASAPDNVPIVALIPLLAFYIYLAWKQANANDQLITQLEGQDAPPQSVALQAGMAKGSPCLAVSAPD